MATISRVTTWSSGQILKAADLNGEFNNITNYLNNADSGATTWNRVLVTNASSVPLVISNSSGSQDVADFQVNGTNKVTINGTGVITSTVASGNSLVIDSPSLIVDSTNHRVGCGTATPSTQLHVSGSSYPQLTVDDNTSRTFAIGVSSSTFKVRDVTGTADRLSMSSTGILSFPNQSGCRIHLSGNQTINQNSETVIAFNTADFDNQSEFDTATNHKFTALQAGLYLVSVQAGYSAFSATATNVYVSIRKNGSQVAAGFSGFGAVGTTGAPSFSCTNLVSLAIGDTIDATTSQNSSGSQTLLAGSGVNTWISIAKVA